MLIRCSFSYNYVEYKHFYFERKKYLLDGTNLYFYKRFYCFIFFWFLKYQSVLINNELKSDNFE